MTDEFDWNRLTISTAFSVGVLLNGIIQPFMGQIFDRTGGRTLVLFSALALGLITMSLGFTMHILFFIFVFGVVASLAQGGLSLTNTSALLSRWFQRKRGTVIGLNSTALSLGGLVMVPFAYFLMTATDSWRIAWVGLGAVVLITLPVGWLFLRNNPSQMNLLPDGDDEPAQQSSGNQRERVPGPLEVTSWRESLKSAPFWQMSGAYFVCGATTFHPLGALHSLRHGQGCLGRSGGADFRRNERAQHRGSDRRRLPLRQGRRHQELVDTGLRIAGTGHTRCCCSRPCWA